MGAMSDDPIVRPRYVNFSVCSRSKCDGLCYDHHPHSDCMAVTQEEISSLICDHHCMQDFCSSSKCRAFWKLQNEVARGREICAKVQEKYKRRCDNLQSELVTRRAATEHVKTSNQSQTFGDAVDRLFSKNFSKLQEFEREFRQDLLTQIYRMGRENSIMKEENSSLKEENDKLKRKIASTDFCKKTKFS